MDLTQIRGGRDVAEYLAHKAWVDLGNPAPNEGKPQNLNDLQYDAFRHAYTPPLAGESPRLQR